jgi:hypothetical protein
MANGHLTREGFDYGGGIEIVADEAEGAMREELAMKAGNNARGFLTTMLQGMQAQGGMRRGVDRTENAEYAALFLEFIECH